MCLLGFVQKEAGVQDGVVGLQPSSVSQVIAIVERYTYFHNDGQAVLCEDTRGKLGAAVGLTLVPSISREQRDSRRVSCNTSSPT